MTVSLDGVSEQIIGVRKDVAELDRDVIGLRNMFSDSSTKQGERIGRLEVEVEIVRNDFKWSMRLTLFVWSFIQGLMLVGLGWYLRA
jgi:hypothetical protein